MAPRTGELQGLAKQAVLKHFARSIATAILQWDRRDESASLADLDEPLRTEYERIGELVALMSDPMSMRVALYAAADEMVAAGLDRLEPKHRIKAVALFTRAYQAMKKQLMGTLPAERSELLHALVEHDTAIGADAQPVNMKPSADINLADLQTTGVQ